MADHHTECVKTVGRSPPRGEVVYPIYSCTQQQARMRTPMSQLSLRRDEETARDMFWIVSRYEQLRKEHADKWIAVKDSHIVMEGSELEPLLKRLKDSYRTSRDFTIEFIAETPRNLLL